MAKRSAVKVYLLVLEMQQYRPNTISAQQFYTDILRLSLIQTYRLEKRRSLTGATYRVPLDILKSRTEIHIFNVLLAHHGNSQNTNTSNAVMY